EIAGRSDVGLDPAASIDASLAPEITNRPNNVHNIIQLSFRGGVEPALIALRVAGDDQGRGCFGPEVAAEVAEPGPDLLSHVGHVGMKETEAAVQDVDE